MNDETIIRKLRKWADARDKINDRPETLKKLDSTVLREAASRLEYLTTGKINGERSVAVFRATAEPQPGTSER